MDFDHDTHTSADPVIGRNRRAYGDAAILGDFAGDKSQSMVANACKIALTYAFVPLVAGWH
ncbi:MAG: hypothetical protein ABL877_06455 [Thiobacillus sp.]